MADSVDRVFVHALNTVKRIPRLGSARPPPAERLKLYGLYKQSMEGDVDGVMDRPRSDNGSGSGSDRNQPQSKDELRSDQQKWDAWYAQKGLSRTEAKRKYITTLIETMRTYASQTADARELVTELEFVWDQIKSNPPSSSNNSHSPSSDRRSQPHSAHNPLSESPQSTSDPPIYPVMSERGSRNPRNAGNSSRKRGREVVDVKVEGTDDRGLRVLSPMSQREGTEPEDDEEEQYGKEDEEDETADELEREAFVDAPDSQVAEGELDGRSHPYSASSGDEHDLGSPSPKSASVTRREQAEPQPPPRNAASAIIEPIAKYIQRQTTARQANADSTVDSTTRWQRRIESALVKMNAEMAALREQLDMQQNERSGSVYSSIVHPFSSRRPSFATGGKSPKKEGFLARLWESALGLAGVLARHLVIDALVLAVVMVWMHWRGIPPERLEELISSWIRRVRALAFFKRLEKKMGKAQAGLKLPVALRRLAPGPP